MTADRISLSKNISQALLVNCSDIGIKQGDVTSDGRFGHEGTNLR